MKLSKSIQSALAAAVVTTAAVVSPMAVAGCAAKCGVKKVAKCGACAAKCGVKCAAKCGACAAKCGAKKGKCAAKK
ncbi:MAG: hypothetical protein WBD13_23350 [Burkholderiaceae bacterium]